MCLLSADWLPNSRTTALPCFRSAASLRASARAAAPRGIEPPLFAFEVLTTVVLDAVPLAVEPSTLAAAASVRLTEALAASVAAR